MISCMEILLPAAITQLPKDMFRKGSGHAVSLAIVEFNNSGNINLPKDDVHNWANFFKVILKNGFNPVIPIECLKNIVNEGAMWGPPPKPDFAGKSESEKAVIRAKWIHETDQWETMHGDKLYKTMCDIFDHVKQISRLHHQILITVLEFAAIFCELALQRDFEVNQNMTPHVFGLLLAPTLMRECNGCCKPNMQHVAIQSLVWPRFIEFSIMYVRKYINDRKSFNSIFKMEQHGTLKTCKIIPNAPIILN